MTREEALHYLDLTPHTPDDVVEEVLEEALFEHKKFLLMQNPVPQVLQKRLEKLEQLEKVERVLLTQTFLPQPPQIYTIEGGTAEELFAQYQNYLSTYKTAVNNSRRASGLVDIVQKGLKLKIEYYQKFRQLFANSKPILNESEKQQISLGKEPDAMEILKAIHFYAKTKQVSVDLQKEIFRINQLLEKLKLS